MAEFEKVKDALSRCTATGNCGNCQYYSHSTECVMKLMKDSLSVMIEQQEEIKRLKAQLDETMLWR